MSKGIFSVLMVSFCSVFPDLRNAKHPILVRPELLAHLVLPGNECTDKFSIKQTQIFARVFIIQTGPQHNIDKNCWNCLVQCNIDYVASTMWTYLSINKNLFLVSTSLLRGNLHVKMSWKSATIFQQKHFAINNFNIAILDHIFKFRSVLSN